MPAYDTRFHPPAPVAEVVLIHPVADITSDPLTGKLDTGADLTVIPEQAIRSLGLAPRGNLWTRGFEGNYSQRSVYYVRMTLEVFNWGSFVALPRIGAMFSWVGMCSIALS